MDAGVGARAFAARGGEREGPGRGRIVEIVIGAVVLAVAAFFLFLAYSTSRIGAVSGYDVTARFSRVDGLHIGSDVELAGVKVGRVTRETLDPKTFLVTVRMAIERQYKLPEDTVAEIVSPGLLGDKYMLLLPGGSDKTIAPGGRIRFTQASVSLEDLIGQMIYSQAGAAKKAGGATAGPTAPAPAPPPGPGGPKGLK